MTARRTGVYLTQFAGSSLTDERGNPVDWSDHKSGHRAVMRLFAPRLAGASDERRVGAGILYRVDIATNGDGMAETTVLVQSLVSPEIVPPEARCIEVADFAWTPNMGERVVFRVAFNPVRRTTRYFSDEAKRMPAPEQTKTGFMRQTASVVPVSELQEWLESRIGSALTDVELISHTRDTSESGCGRQMHKVIVDTIDAIGVVADPAALDALRRIGVGRSKSYGCGLLTIRRLL